MKKKIESEETFENSQRVRDEHWRSGEIHELFISHRSSCPYCFKRLMGLPLPKLRVIVRSTNTDSFEEIEIFDENDPRRDTKRGLMTCHKCGFQVYMDGSCNCTKQFQGKMFGQSQSTAVNNLYMDSLIKGIDQIGGLLMEIRDLLKTGFRPVGEKK